MNRSDCFPQMTQIKTQITQIKTQITQNVFNNNFYTLETMKNIKIFYQTLINLKDFNLLTFYHTY